MRVVPTVPARVFAVNGTAYSSLLQHVTTAASAASLLQAFKFWFSHGGEGMIGPLPWAWGPLVGTSAVYDLLAAWAAVATMNVSSTAVRVPTCISEQAAVLRWKTSFVRVADSGFTQFCEADTEHIPTTGTHRSLSHSNGCVSMQIASGWPSVPPSSSVFNVTSCIASVLVG